MAKGKQATINGERTVKRIAGRLERARRAIVSLETEAKDASILDVSYRRRCRDKARALQAEAQQLEGELKGIRSAIDSTIA